MVDPLRRVIQYWTKRHILGDVVTTVIGGDGAGVPLPRCYLVRAMRWATEWSRPGSLGDADDIEHSANAGLNQSALLIEDMPHIGGRRADGLRDQPDDETRHVVCAAGVSEAGGGASEAMVDDGGDIVDVSESTSLDEA